MMPFVDLKLQHKKIESELKEAINRVFEESNFIFGKDIELLEEEFVKYIGVNFGVACSSGTSALHLALLACGIKAGDEVITTPHTFIATVEAISHVGAVPVFVDIEDTTYNIDPALIEKAISKKTRAIIVVHLYGQCANMELILNIARKYDIRVIEDCAQSHGALYKGRKAGSVGDVGCFSFFPGKNLGAMGDAGIVVTNDKDMSVHMKALRNHGRKDKYEHFIVGYNYRISSFQAAILRIKLKYLDENNKLRQAAANQYNNLLKNSGFILPVVGEENSHVFHLYVIRTQLRNQLVKMLQKNGISVGIHYPIPIHLQIAYKFLGYNKGAFPVAEKIANEIISLPMFPGMTLDNIIDIVEMVKKSSRELKASTSQLEEMA